MGCCRFSMQMFLLPRQAGSTSTLERGFSKGACKYSGVTAKWATQLLNLSFTKLKACAPPSLLTPCKGDLGITPSAPPERIRSEGEHRSDCSWEQSSLVQQDGCTCLELALFLLTSTLTCWEPAAQLRKMEQEGNARHKRLPWASHLRDTCSLRQHRVSCFYLSNHRSSPEMLRLSACTVLSLCFLRGRNEGNCCTSIVCDLLSFCRVA